MGILEPFRLYLEAAPQVPTRLISHVPHFSRVGKLPGSHRDHFVAVGLKRHPFRGITRYLRRRQVFRIRIVLDHQPYFPVTHVGNKRLATGNATSPFARPDSTIQLEIGNPITPITLRQTQNRPEKRLGRRGGIINHRSQRSPRLLCAPQPHIAPNKCLDTFPRSKRHSTSKTVVSCRIDVEAAAQGISGFYQLVKGKRQSKLYKAELGTTGKDTVLDAHEGPLREREAR